MRLKKITILTGLALLATSQAYSHAYVETPKGRPLLCNERVNQGCGNISLYEPQSFEVADGSFENGSMGDQVGGAGLSAALSEQTASRWAKTVVRSGPTTIRWHFTASHWTISPASFRVWITKPDWNPNMPLSRSDFEVQSLNCYNPIPNFTNAHPADANSKFTMTCDLPARTGYQVLAAEWNVGDTGASFLNVIDVDFTDAHPAGTVILPSGDTDNGGTDNGGTDNGGTDNGGTDNGGSAGGLQEYDPNKSYPDRGTEVIYEGKVYASKWWVNPGQIPGAIQWGPWEYIRDHEQTNPSDRFPVKMNTFTINDEDVREGDRVILQVSKDGVMKEYDLVTVPRGMSANDLIKEMTAKINQISTQELNSSIIAGVKDNNGNVVPNDELVSIYQVATKPYSDISFQYYQGEHHLKNELHLMGFEDQYDLNSNGSVNITAKIMSHASDKTNVFVTLQDSSGKAVYDKRDIQIDPMQTYDLSLTAHNLQPGEYDLIIGSVLQGAPIWQKDMKIQLGETPANISEYDTNTKYKAGDKVKVGSSIYECKGWPYTDWCSVSAYRPDGIYGDQAWIKL
ncbi:lytic polysaccharide monooxygenase [Francisella sp. 19X1-34]|uniref:lytic polysaccharide monooxygenase n=1 Tax=Francisella sp. 19X1-34 TaxID=3087177 RepID=UPI002E31FBCB|nr:lytic polysaccharide monooxygenase [Francisella sp. 19X1-34]MED7789356.1 lytic polysaccharide monooxygenase [Francisella sp. 19X1-34]